MPVKKWARFIIYIGLTRLIPESPRWLISKGRKDDAVKIIKRTAKVNKAHVPEHMYDIKDDDVNVEMKKGKLWHIFASAVLLKRTLILCFAWYV